MSIYANLEEFDVQSRSMSKIRITILLISMLGSTVTLTECMALDDIDEKYSVPTKLNTEAGPKIDEVSVALDEEVGLPKQLASKDRAWGFGSWLKNVIKRVVDPETEKAVDLESENTNQDYHPNRDFSEQKRQTASDVDEEKMAVVDTTEQPEKSAVSPSSPLAPMLYPSDIDSYMDVLEADLRRRLSGRGVGVIRGGQNITLNIPNKVLFKSKSYMLGDPARVIAKNLVDVITKYHGIDVEIAGHTDNQGPGVQNHRLSKQRAESIAIFLRNQGVGEGRIFTVGYGERRPIASNMDKKGRSQNRRMEISLYPQP
ncbi:MAG: OmpA family protein [Gammaproteobacteria bacterium]|nr:OmpA family protein [Gammaproteobacteria bacterium]